MIRVDDQLSQIPKMSVNYTENTVFIAKKFP